MTWTFNPFTNTLDRMRNPAPVPGPHEWTHVLGGVDDIDAALNPLAYPLFAGLAAARPVVGVPGRSYYSTDTLVLERDNGVAWVEVARGETATRLAQLAERAHASLTGIGPNQHHPQIHAAEHENGGGDEIDVGGLSGLLADPQTPLPHAGTHENGGADEISVAGLSGLLADDQHVLDAEVLAVAAALIHATRHENGGADEISIAGLSGLAADDQHVLDAEVLLVAAALVHAARHENGGADEISVLGLSGLLADGQTPLAHKDTHDPQTGADPLDCGIPTGNVAEGVAAAEGVGDELTRVDHVHACPAAWTPAAHKDTHDPQTGADSLDCAAPPVNVTPEQANAEGAADTLARSDHMHYIPSGTPPVNITPEQANAEGVAAEFARTDHMHNLPSGAASSVGVGNTEGVAAAFARQDHVHDGRHDILDGSKHSDSVADVVTKGSLIAGNTTPKWDELVRGTDGYLLMSDVAQALGIKWTDTLMIDLNFATYMAVAMTCDQGATVPGAPVKGQWFLHTPTNRNILMMYNGTNWIPIVSIGAMTVYVDDVNGTDAIDNGGTNNAGVDTPFATLQYAVDTIPGLVGGNVIIDIDDGVAGTTYNETVTIQGKMRTGNYTIRLTGTLTIVSSGTGSANGVRGTAAIQGIVTDTGNMGGADNYLLWVEGDGTPGDADYRIIDKSCWEMGYDNIAHAPVAGDIIHEQGGTAWGVVVAADGALLTYIPVFGLFANNDVIDIMINSSVVANANAFDVDTTVTPVQQDTDNLAIVGTFTSQPLINENYIIYDWGTKIENIVINPAQTGIVLEFLEIVASAGYGLWCYPLSSTQAYYCRFDNSVLTQQATLLLDYCIIERETQGWNCLLCQAFSYLDLTAVKVFRPFDTGDTVSVTTTNIAINAGCIIDGNNGDANKATHGIYAAGCSTVIFYTPLAQGRNWVRSCDTGLFAVEGAEITWTEKWYVQKCANGTDLLIEVGGINSTILSLAEQASSFWTSIAGEGTFWVKDDAPNVPMYTDDANTDFNITIV